MNILIVHEVSYRKKVVYEYQEFAEMLASRGHSVNVIDFEEHGDVHKEPENVSRTGNGTVELASIPCSSLPIARYITAKANYGKILERTLDRKNIEVVFLYSVFINGTSTVTICKRKGIPVVYRVLDAYHKMRTNPIVSTILRTGEQYIYRNATAISVTNQAMSKYVDSIAGVKRKNAIGILQHGVDEYLFQPRKRDTVIAQELGIFEEDRVAVFVGTLFEFCGLDIVIKNMGTIKTQVPTAKIIIVGDGAMIHELKELAKESNFQDCIKIIGRREYKDVPRYLSLANATINPFRINDITRDIVPIKTLQYLACGVPLVSAPLTEVMRIFPTILSGATYVDIQDGKAFASAIATALEDSEQSQVRGLLARNIILDEFTISDTISNLENVLYTQISNARTAKK